MNDDKIKKIINDTVTTTVLQLKAAGLLRDNTKSAYEKTEELLKQYPQLCQVREPYAERVVREIDACLAEASDDPYINIIRLYYFEGLANEAAANKLPCDERTGRRNRQRLVRKFSARLASDDFIRELLM